MIDPMEMSLLKECRDLDNALTKRKKELQSLSQSLSWGDMSTNRPKRYSIDLDFIPNPKPIAGGQTAEELTANLSFLQPQVESFVVDGGTNFYCSTIESSVRFTGNVQVNTIAPSGAAPIYTEGQPATITLGYGNPNPGTNEGIYRQSMFSFDWFIRDTGSDRDWQNVPQPDVFLCSGRLGPLILPAFSRVKGGSEVEATVTPTLNVSADGVFFNDTVAETTSLTKITVQLSFHGFERIL